MDNTSFFQVLLTLLSLSTLYLLHSRRRTRGFPPGPPGWPILGNLLDLGLMPHRTLTKLRKQYGDVIGLRLGSMNTMVILSAKAAAEFFKNHDVSFAERTITETMRVHGYNEGSLALAPYGPYWRVLRKLVTVDMVVMKKINDTASIRRKCVDDMLRWIEEETENKVNGHHGVHVAKFVFFMSTNLLGNLMLSRDLVDPESRKGSEFFDAILGLMETSGYANVADYFPWLKWVDPQGLKRKMNKELGKALEIASEFVKERIEKVKVCENKRKDFLDVLLEFVGNGKDEPAKISGHDINIFILEIFMAGSETTSSTIEWALTQLLLNPHSMKKAKIELTSLIGPNTKLQEAHIENLPFLQAIVKETLRLHPPIPFLVPRKAIQDTNFMGFDIPQNTQVLVNAWAIGRDPEVWDDPLRFKPERFLGSSVDYRGQDYGLIPFGAGRRMCAGVSLGHRILHLVLGSLIHHFDWEFDGDLNPQKMDMGDRLGITMRKATPLLAVPKRCKCNVMYDS